MRYEISGKYLECSHCDYQGFQSSSAQLNTALMTFFDFDWLNKSAHVFECEQCGKIEWFGGNAKVVEHDDLTESDCLSCAGRIGAGETRCASCGWSYED